MQLDRDYRKHEDAEELPDNPAVRFVRRRFNATEDYRGTKLTVVENGKRMITPMLIVTIALASTDSLFALDSIPAIYGLTQEPYLVFTRRVRADGPTTAVLLARRVAEEARRPVGWPVGTLGFIRIKLILHALYFYHLADRRDGTGRFPSGLRR